MNAKTHLKAIANPHIQHQRIANSLGRGEGAYASYEADFIESSEIEDALDDKYIVAVCVGLKNEKDIIENCG